MKNNLTQLKRVVLASTVAIVVSACGGGSSGGTTQMKLAVADAPVDGATAVIVKFTGVELTGNGGNPVTINFAQPKTIDLLNDSGKASAVLFDQPIPSGSYGQVRLVVIADGNPSNSYIDISDGSRHGLRVPSGEQSGLKLVSGFNAPDSGVVDYTIDFDLRKAITCPAGQAPACILKPALRLVDNKTVGNIQGTVNASLVPTDCTPAVYLYAGTVTAPEDNNGAATSSNTNQPLASKVPQVTAQAGGGYYYQFTFLPPGSYTAAFTCKASLDNPDQADPTVTFSPIKSGISVTSQNTATVNFP